jgi:DNA helicase-2/ATP-dependent DNA helicase PcrA
LSPPGDKLVKVAAKALDGLDPEQAAAAAALLGPVCIIAGAGTGKTRTVTHRLAYGVETGTVDPRRALAITHSRKAAAELGERLRRLGVDAVDARTFHAAGLWVVKTFWPRTGRPEAAPSVLADNEAWRLWRDAVRATAGHEPDNAEVRDVIDEVGWARSQMVGVDGYPAAAELAGRHPGPGPGTVVRCWELFAAAKARVGRLDFADLLEMAAGLVESDAEVATAVRDRWAHVTVDEYQDTDAAQQRLLEAVMGDGRDICVVGDPRQAIYSWKGADSRFLTGFARRYPGAAVFDLSRNFRSTPQVLALANRLAPERRTKALVATRPPGRPPKITRADNEQGESAWVAAAARRAMAAGTPASEIAVLYRFNATQARFEAAFARAGVATVIAEDLTFFDREEVRAVLVPFGRAARAQPETNGLELLVSIAARSGFNRDRPPEGLGAARARWESQQALLELLEAAPGAVEADARTLLAEVNSLAVRTHGPRTAGVTLATLHRSKGLEWDVVFLVGMTDGAMPSVYATSPEELAEEERLLHVGVTRARSELHLTWASASPRGWENKPSPFLDFVTGVRPPAAKEPARAGRSGRAERAGRSARRSGHDDATASASAVVDCPHCAGPLRGIAARRLGVCSHCVMSVPGETGERARALAAVIEDAAQALGRTKEQLVGPSAVMRLLDQRPATAEDVIATTGVGLRGAWAQAAAAVLGR